MLVLSFLIGQLRLGVANLLLLVLVLVLERSYFPFEGSLFVECVFLRILELFRKRLALMVGTVTRRFSGLSSTDKRQQSPVITVKLYTNLGLSKIRICFQL